MQKKIVAFSGEKKDNYGMPTPFHFYAIFVSPYATDRSYFAVSTLAFSRDTPPGTEGSILVQAASEEEVLRLAIEQLKKHPANANLTMQLSDIPTVNL